jgi:hypothetical protein
MYTVTEFQHGRPLRDKIEARTWRGLMRKLQGEVWWQYGSHWIMWEHVELGAATNLLACVENRRAQNELLHPAERRLKTDLPSVSRREFLKEAQRR